MAATKFLDAIARMPGNDGEDSDAFSAYTQVDLDELPKLLGKSASKDLITETWLSLPRNRRPQSWDNIEEPMVRLKVNLYGHPLAGRIWAKNCQHYHSAMDQRKIFQKKIILVYIQSDFTTSKPKIPNT